MYVNDTAYKHKAVLWVLNHIRLTTLLFFVWKATFFSWQLYFRSNTDDCFCITN